MEDEKITVTERILIGVSKFLSASFMPFFIPLVAFFVLFTFTYLRIMPYQYKLIVLGIVCCFTILMPVVTIYLFLRFTGATPEALSERTKRYAPYLLTIISFIFCLMMMYRLNIPWYMSGIILAAILIMIVFFLTNLVWKVSAHAGGMGAIIGGIVSFANLFGYNPVWLLCVFILLAGLVGSARIILGKHTLTEVLGGFTIGLFCSMTVLHPMGNSFLRQLLF